MIIERHYDDEALISLLESRRVDDDTHLASCRGCSAKLDSFRDISAVLTEGDVWDTRAWSFEPAPSSIARIRAFATQIADEDARAEAFVAQLLEGSRDQWMPRLRQHPEWRTAGVVRKLLERTTAVVQTNPPDGLMMAFLGTEIADHLDERNDSGTRAFLSGSAWRERAYALYYVGQFTDALAACDRAEASLDGCVVDEYERARVGIARALILRPLEEIEKAEESIRSSVETFQRFEENGRLTLARLTEVHLLFTRSSFEKARVILEDLDRRVAGAADATSHATVLSNLGYCYWKLGRIPEALRSHEAAATLLDHVGLRTNSVRVQWNIASILFSEGQADEAERRFSRLKRDFDELGMTSEAALVRLDLAELMLSREQYAEIDMLCREAIAIFEKAGIPYGTRARTALSYLQEAARARKATTVIVKHVREYIRRLPQDGQLLFASPPSALE